MSAFRFITALAGFCYFANVGNVCLTVFFGAMLVCFTIEDEADKIVRAIKQQSRRGR